MTAELFTNEELKENKYFNTHLNHDEEECKKVFPPTLKDKMNCIENYQICFVCQNP